MDGKEEELNDVTPGLTAWGTATDLARQIHPFVCLVKSYLYRSCVGAQGRLYWFASVKPLCTLVGGCLQDQECKEEGNPFSLLENYKYKEGLLWVKDCYG